MTSFFLARYFSFIYNLPRMRFPYYSLLLGAVLLSSCSLFKSNEYMPLYLQEPSPLDPPGTEELRAKMRAERVKEGIFAAGDTPEVQQGRVYLLDRNPDYSENPSGRMVATGTVKVLSCEGTYYFVEAEDGKRGFLRESDMMRPITLVSTSDFVPLPGEGLMPGADGLLPFEQAPLKQDATPQLRVNEDGRTVVVVGKKSDKSREFEARRRALEADMSAGAGTPAPAVEEDFDAALPDPTGSAQ